MLTPKERTAQIKSQIDKERNQKSWEWDIHCYHRYLSIIYDLENNNRDASFWRDKLKKIREKYPTVKNWPE